MNPPVDTRLSEEGVISSLMIDPSILPAIKQVVQPTHFRYAKYRVMYDAILALEAKGMDIDVTTVADELVQAEELNTAGGYAGIAETMAAQVSPVNAESYAEIVYREGFRRNMIEEVETFTRRLFTPSTQPSDIHQYTTMLSNIIPRGKGATELNSGQSQGLMESLVDSAMESFITGRSAQLDWPWPSWNERVLPAMAGILYLIAGAQGSGKSTMLAQIAEHMARRGNKVLLVHLEDDTPKKLFRRITRHLGIPYQKLRTGEITKEQRDVILKFEEEVSQTWGPNLTYLHARRLTIEEILEYVKGRAIAGEVDVFILDYLNKAKMMDNAFQGDWMLPVIIMDALKETAEEFQIPVITAAQLTKAGKTKQDKTGIGIRGGGEIIDKAQVVWTIYRELLERDMRHPQTHKLVARAGQESPVTEMAVVKNNDGPRGQWDMWMDGPRYLFRDTP